MDGTDDSLAPAATSGCTRISSPEASGNLPPESFERVWLSSKRLGFSAYRSSQKQKRKLSESGAEADTPHAKRINMDTDPEQTRAIYRVRLVVIVSGLTSLLISAC